MTPAAFRAIEPKAIELARSAIFTGERERHARRLIATMSDPARLSILRALRRTPMAASDLAHVIGRTRSATSQHLRVLREADAVASERRGNVIRYRLSGSMAGQILSDVASAFDRLAP